MSEKPDCAKTKYRIKWGTRRKTWWLCRYSDFCDMSWTPYESEADEYAFDEAYRIVYHMQTLNRSAIMVAVLEEANHETNER